MLNCSHDKTELEINHLSINKFSYCFRKFDSDQEENQVEDTSNSFEIFQEMLEKRKRLCSGETLFFVFSGCSFILKARKWRRR